VKAYINYLDINSLAVETGERYPHFCTLIEQSATLMEKSTTISLKPVGSYFSNIEKCLKIHSQSL